MRECTRVNVCTYLDAYVCAGHLGAVLLGLICGMYWEYRCWIPGITCLEDCLPLCLSSCQSTESNQLIILALAKPCCLDRFLLHRTSLLIAIRICCVPSESIVWRLVGRYDRRCPTKWKRGIS